MINIASTSTAIEIRRNNIHNTIKYILKLIPLAQTQIFSVISDHFPHKRFDITIQTEYVSQILYICEYIPSIQLSVLDLILTKSLELDVEIIIEETGMFFFDFLIKHSISLKIQ